MIRRMICIASIVLLVATVAGSPPATAAFTTVPGGGVAGGGVAGGGAQPWNTRRPADYAAMRAAGARWLRADIAWASLQPTDAPYQWGLYDPVVADARAAGLEYLAILHTVPAWANGGRGDYAPASDVALQTAYCYEVVRRYLPRGVRHYEIGNEVNLPHPGWTTTGRYYVRNLLGPCVSGVRRAATELRLPVTVLMGALAPPECCDGASPTTYLTDVYDAGGAGMFDLLSWHPYTVDPPTHPNMNALPDQLNAITVARTGSSRPIWATEYGVPTGGDIAVDETSQARLVTTAYDAWWRHPYSGPLFWYAIRDEGAPPSTEREHYFGLLRNDGTPKPAYAAFSRVLGATAERTRRSSGTPSA